MLDLTRAELARVAADGITDDGARPGQGHDARARSCSGLEDTGSRMSRLAKGELLYGDLLLRRRAAGPGRRGHRRRGQRGVAAELLTRPMSLAVVGPFDKNDTFPTA